MYVFLCLAVIFWCSITFFFSPPEKIPIYPGSCLTVFGTVPQSYPRVCFSGWSSVRSLNKTWLVSCRLCVCVSIVNSRPNRPPLFFSYFCSFIAMLFIEALDKIPWKSKGREGNPMEKSLIRVLAVPGIQTLPLLRKNNCSSFMEECNRAGS